MKVPLKSSFPVVAGRHNCSTCQWYFDHVHLQSAAHTVLSRIMTYTARAATANVHMMVRFHCTHVPWVGRWFLAIGLLVLVEALYEA